MVSERNYLMQFNELNLSAEILQAVDELGYESMTEIQEKSIPLLMEGRDVIGRSNTGTGKTAAFGIPAIERLDPELKKVQVIIICPTRELAMQACDELRKFSKFKRGVRAVSVFGGASMEKQILELKRGANIVVGTPGRIMDHMRRKTLRLDEIKTVILDEADEMLNMGFREDIESILTEVPEERQTVLFSATMPAEILAITRNFQKDPITIKIEAKHRTVESIAQYAFDVAMGRKTDALKLLLAAYSPKSSMIFCNTKKMVDELLDELLKSGFRAAGIHGDMKQMQRTQVMNSFKSGAVQILIATDVAARGIDVSGIDAVFNYDLPQDNEYYIHRIGRTGRAGLTGAAYTLVSGRRQLQELHNISRFTKATIKILDLPEKAEVIDGKCKLLTEEIAALAAESMPSERSYALLDRLVEVGLSEREVAASLIDEKINALIASLPEFDIPRPLRRFPENNGGGQRSSKTVKVEINAGRSHRMAPNFILGALVDATGLTGRDFGKIDIFDKHTTVEVPESQTNHVIDSMNKGKINGTHVEVKLHKPTGKSTYRGGSSRYGENRNGNREQRHYDSGRGDYARSRASKPRAAAKPQI